MNVLRKGLIYAMMAILLLSLAAAGCIGKAETGDTSPNAQPTTRTITDMRGVEVTIPATPSRVVDISRGLVDEVMYIFGLDDTIVGGSFYQGSVKPGEYVWDDVDYTVNTYISMVLMPRLADASEVTNVGGFGGPYGGVPKVETVLSLEPDLLILRDFGGDDENTSNFISLIEEVGIPVVVLKYPDCYAVPSPDSIYEEVRVLGAVFGYEESAESIIVTMKSRVDTVIERTSTVPVDERPSVLFFGAPTWAGDQGGVGVAFGTGTIEVAFLNSVLHGCSAYTGSGRTLVSSEQVLAMDPDVILLPTWSGYHPPRQLYEAAYSEIADLRALREGSVYALATTPVNSQRLEFSINLMIAAKALYPSLFDDIDLGTWIRAYLSELYGTDEAMIEGMVDALMLAYLEIA
ncbi:MAG: ABC transporter substrate-binding protein [Candidatus Methanofastidiosa archaeon]|nr:ABC transporter substrate-binding protein [Candidatus Methanofastidiosa archaeon]